MKIPSEASQIDQWKSIMFLYDSALKEINTKIEILNNEFVQINDYNPIEHVKSRLKTPESIVKKLKRNGYDVTIENMVEKLSDIAGIRIICSFRTDIYLLADMISRQRDVTVLYVKDYIKTPKSNGYRSYHMVVTVPIYLNGEMVETKVEIQIRTVAMDFWASLEHDIHYKADRAKLPAGIDEEMFACAEKIAEIDQQMQDMYRRIADAEANGDAVKK